MTPLISIAKQSRVSINSWKGLPWSHYSVIGTVLFDFLLKGIIEKKKIRSDTGCTNNVDSKMFEPIKNF